MAEGGVWKMNIKPRKKEKRSRSKWEGMDAENCSQNPENTTVKINVCRKKGSGGCPSGGAGKSGGTGQHQPKPSPSTVTSAEGECLDAVKELEFVCLPKWTGELVDKLSGDKLKDEYSLTDYLEKRLRRKEFQLPPPPQQTRKKKGKNQALKVPTQQMASTGIPFGSHEWISIKLCLASLALYLKHRDRATSELDHSRNALYHKFNEVSKSHRLAYHYLIESLQCAISILIPKFGKGSKNPPRYSAPELVAEQTEKITEDWEQLKVDLKGVAVLHYVRGCLCRILGNDDVRILNKFKKAAELEPDFYLWQQLVYENIRRIRKLEGKEMAPREDEVDACRRAYELCRGDDENKVGVTMDWAMMRKEVLRSRPMKWAEENETEAKEEGTAIIWLLKEVIDNPLCSEGTLRNAHIVTAEMYTFKELKMNANEGKVIFLECYRRWPKNSGVLHKVGKFYHYGLSGGQFQDAEKAKQIYKEGIEASGGNFPCLMDYLKLLGKGDRDYNQMIDLIDRYRNFQKGHPERMVKLLTLRGLCYWLRDGDDREKDKMTAVENWVEALVNFPTLWIYVLNGIRGNEALGQLDIDLKEVIRFVRKFCKKTGIPRKGSIDDFVGEIEHLNK